MHPLLRRNRTRTGAALLTGAVLALLALPAVALATTAPPVAPPDADASCDTLPTTYPGNGVPVPETAFCAVVQAPAGESVAEVWAWGDEAGLHWYNYVAEGYEPGPGYALTMCATADDAAAGVVYACTTDSHYLLFTMSNMFVTWPSELDSDLYFCESVEVVGLDGIQRTAHACGTLSVGSAGGSEPEPTTPSPTPSDPPAPPATTAPTQPPPSEPADPPADDPADPGVEVVPPVAPPVTTNAVQTTTPPLDEGVDNPRDLPESAFEPGPAATPIDSQSVALVEGAAFPIALVFALAGALALGGVAVLAGPGALAALRRRH